MILMGPEVDGVTISRPIDGGKYTVSANVGSDALVTMLRTVADQIEQGNFNRVVEAEYIPPAKRSNDLPTWFLAFMYGGIFSAPASQCFGWLFPIKPLAEFLLFFVLWGIAVVGWLLYDRRQEAPRRGA